MSLYGLGRRLSTTSGFVRHEPPDDVPEPQHRLEPRPVLWLGLRLFGVIGMVFVGFTVSVTFSGLPPELHEPPQVPLWLCALAGPAIPLVVILWIGVVGPARLDWSGPSWTSELDLYRPLDLLDLGMWMGLAGSVGAAMAIPLAGVEALQAAVTLFSASLGATLRFLRRRFQVKLHG